MPDHIYRFLSTPSARRATLTLAVGFGDSQISIHALREEGDLLDALAFFLPVIISIHALREEGDPECLLPGCAEKNFYPRPPRGGRR